MCYSTCASLITFTFLCESSLLFAQEFTIPPAEDIPGSVALEVREYLNRVDSAQKVYHESVERSNKQLMNDIQRRLKRAEVTDNKADQASLRAFLNQISQDRLARNIAFDWTPIFRGITGEHFNSNHQDNHEGFAIELNRDIQITYLRITNLTNKQSVVVRCQAKLSDLATEFPIDEEWI